MREHPLESALYQTPSILSSSNKFILGIDLNPSDSILPVCFCQTLFEIWKKSLFDKPPDKNDNRVR